MLRNCTRTFASALLLVSFSLSAAAGMPFQVDGEPPQWLGADQDGEDVRLDDYPDRVRVVSFWATWCAPCLTELELLEQLQSQIPESELRIFAVNVHERNHRRVRRMLIDLDEPELLFTSDINDRLVDEHGIKSIPLMVMIDHLGEIRHVHQGYGEDMLDRIIDELNALLVEQARARRPVSGQTAP